MNRRLFVRRLASLVVALAALAPAGRAQDAAEAAARDRLARVAKEHGVAGWPAAGAAVGGIPVAKLELPPGFAVLERAFDARRGEVALSLGKAGAAAPSAVATVRLHASPKAAREALIAALGAMQVRAEGDPAAGQLAFGVRGPDGRRRLVLGSRANVTWSARLLDPDAAGAGAPALDLVSSSIDRLVQAQPAGSPAGPRLLDLAPVAGRARAGEATALRLDHDPASPEPAHAAFECTGDASVLATRTGYELLAPAAGPVEVRVFAMSDDLRVSAATFKLVVE